MTFPDTADSLLGMLSCCLIPFSAASGSPAPAPAPPPTAAHASIGEAAAEPEPSGLASTSFPTLAPTDGPAVNVKVKFGKLVVPLAINVGAGVPPILEQLADVTKVPVSSQTLLGPGGRKWTAASDLSTLGVKDGMKLTLIGKVPPGWRALEAVEKGKPPDALGPKTLEYTQTDVFHQCNFLAEATIAAH